MTTNTQPHPFRVFIAYSHKDHELVEKIVAVLEEDFGLNPVWDRHIHPGMPFTDAIREMIASAHLFIPLLTENSKERPWVHQETGYAMALNVPVLPIATAGCLPEELAAQLQAIEITDAEDLRQQLQEVDFERIIFPSRTRLQNISQEAFWPEERTELLARYADLAVELARGGILISQAVRSTFLLLHSRP